MSSTRHNFAGDFKAERWASSPALDRPLNAKLVAMRCSVLESPEVRAAVWFVQAMSLKPGGLRWLAAEIVPDTIATEDRISWLAEACLNPQANHHLQMALPRLREVIFNYARQRGEGVAVTAIGHMIYEALDYCAKSKCLVMVSGKSRTGKTFAAVRWCEQNLSRARFCEVPASGDDLSFYMAIARALGVTLERDTKAKAMKPRIEAVLQGGDILLVLDEAAGLWPAANHRPPSRPPRLSWVLQMINAGASIALIATPNFFASQQDYLEKTRWQDAQFYGRIEKYVALPDTLSLDDLERVARACFPAGDRKSIEVLADVANLSQKHLAAIVHTLRQANYFASQDGRKSAEFCDISRAVQTGILPADEALAAALKAVRRTMPADYSRQ